MLHNQMDCSCSVSCNETVFMLSEAAFALYVVNLVDERDMFHLCLHMLSTIEVLKIQMS